MATLCRPAVSVPEHVITMEDTLQLARSRHPDHPQLPLALRLIENTGVRTRHLDGLHEALTRVHGVREAEVVPAERIARLKVVPGQWDEHRVRKLITGEV